jgi:hypothetical protein
LLLGLSGALLVGCASAPPAAPVAGPGGPEAEQGGVQQGGDPGGAAGAGSQGAEPGVGGAQATGAVLPGQGSLPASPACVEAEVGCGFARCDTRAGRCAFPCGSDGDCLGGARCLPSPGNRAIAACQLALPFQ